VATVTDPDASRGFERDLRAVLNATLLGSAGFCCASERSCRASAGQRGFGFAAAQLPYLGERYATVSDGIPYRVMVVSMQVGEAEEFIDIERRREQVVVRIPQTPGQQSPHARRDPRTAGALRSRPDRWRRATL